MKTKYDLPIGNYYSYMTVGDGLVEFKTKQAALRNAQKASNRENTKVVVVSPKHNKSYELSPEN